MFALEFVCSYRTAENETLRFAPNYVRFPLCDRAVWRRDGTWRAEEEKEKKLEKK